MFNHRMASRPLLYLALWTAASSLAIAGSPGLSSDIASSIPLCAQRCLQSFISANFDADICGTAPSLECLCKQTGKSGFTVGEGGVQCVIAESNRKACRGSDASGQAVAKAYGMCLGVPNAAPETHATIVATLVIPSGTGAIIVPTATITTSVRATVSAPRPTSSSSSESFESSTSTTTSTTSPASATMSAQPTASSTPGLSTVQIAGISFGVVATVALAIGLVFLARCIRKRRFGNRESAYMSTRSSRGFGLLKSSQNSPQLQISAPISKTPVEMDFRRPGDHESMPPSTIGLAISPPPSVISASVARGSGRSMSYTRGVQDVPGLPKPTLTLTIPPEPVQPQQGPRMVSTGRESVVTEFAEDGENDSAGGAQIWRPPPTDPHSATTYYVADKWGNWILGNQNRRSQAAELEVPSRLSRTKSERAVDAQPESPVEGASQTLAPPTKATQAKLGSPIVFKDKSTVSGITMSPSVYSNFSAPQSIALPPGSSSNMPKVLPPPSTYFDLMRKGSSGDRKSSTQRRKSRRASRAERRKSSDSATTIESASGAFEYEDEIDDEPQEDLSPVVESPATPISAGTSPVTYPRIPGTRSSTSRQLTPQKGPALTLFPAPLRTSVSNPYGQSNPTIRAVEPVKTHRVPAPTQVQNNRQPLNAMTLNPNPNYNPANIRTGSPEVRTGSAAPEQRQKQQQQQQQRRPSPPQNLQLKPSSAQASEHRRVASIQTTHSAESYNSNASSLLAKRLGPDRAVALTLGGGGQGGIGKSGPGKWKREDDRDGQGLEQLPATPGWLPKLTPTRRGDDLFLNVQ